nr:hypothetical protein [Angustibacter aerolatus]
MLIWIVLALGALAFLGLLGWRLIKQVIELGREARSVRREGRHRTRTSPRGLPPRTTRAARPGGHHRPRARRSGRRSARRVD